jgi:hypothetical protein
VAEKEAVMKQGAKTQVVEKMQGATTQAVRTQAVRTQAVRTQAAKTREERTRAVKMQAATTLVARRQEAKTQEERTLAVKSKQTVRVKRIQTAKEKLKPNWKETVMAMPMATVKAWEWAWVSGSPHG